MDHINLSCFIAGTPAEDLLTLAKQNEEWRTILANSKLTHPEVLEYLSKDENWEIRAAVARNPNTPPEILVELSKDNHPLVRWEVAVNPITPLEGLNALANDPWDKLRAEVYANLVNRFYPQIEDDQKLDPKALCLSAPPDKQKRILAFLTPMLKGLAETLKTDLQQYVELLIDSFYILLWKNDNTDLAVREHVYELLKELEAIIADDLKE